MKPAKVSDESPVSSSPVSPSVVSFTNKWKMHRKSSFGVDSPLAIHSSSVSSLGLSEVANTEGYVNNENRDISSDSSSEDESYNSVAHALTRSSFDSSFFPGGSRSSIEYQRNAEMLKRQQASYFSSIPTKLSESGDANNELLEKRDNTTLLKKSVSKASSSLKPQLKSFRRISHELQSEMMPLDTEVRLEAAVTHALKDEAAIINRHHKNSSFFNSNPQSYFNEDFLKKNELISKANKAWNHQRRDSASSILLSNKRKNSHSHSRPTSIISNFDTSDSDSSVVPIEYDRAKRKNTDEDYFSVKRRAVSTSPSLASSPSSFFGKRNSKIVQSTSENLEKMKLS